MILTDVPLNKSVENTLCVRILINLARFCFFIKLQTPLHQNLSQSTEVINHDHNVTMQDCVKDQLLL